MLGRATQYRESALCRHLPTDSLVVIIAVRVAVGWLSTAVHGTGFGLISDMAVGIVGALIGDWLLLRLNVGLGEGIVPLLINAAIGAIILVLIIKFASGDTGWRGGLRYEVQTARYFAGRTLGSPRPGSSPIVASSLACSRHCDARLGGQRSSVTASKYPSRCTCTSALGRLRSFGFRGFAANGRLRSRRSLGGSAGERLCIAAATEPREVGGHTKRYNRNIAASSH
jgi:uncharacterized membrane protein YeaQ/YmgE (transglycosylase-associated protein family)